MIWWWSGTLYPRWSRHWGRKVDWSKWLSASYFCFSSAVSQHFHPFLYILTCTSIRSASGTPDTGEKQHQTAPYLMKVCRAGHSHFAECSSELMDGGWKACGRKLEHSSVRLYRPPAQRDIGLYWGIIKIIMMYVKGILLRIIKEQMVRTKTMAWL